MHNLKIYIDSIYFLVFTIENLIKDAQELDTQVVMLVNKPRTKDKLMHLGFETLLTDTDFVYDRTQALTLAHQKLHNAGVLIGPGR